ncbi:hypothetical protein PTSG_01702 [Salpingoeca rosetta]|uniref:Uncharacterized protein n=1 Tax=Salpingoeca rosetta (strain ATCC 50818 / BSB-021) TaxID=946362 RepID=F2TYP8_SALR5|nr:uncharacterized protein PTSG_01702 [Salpingoeca rosetta]EGD78722.1 hypothetical protein PTSG_01702 [Salpingoeca rosetta]|eukprot:XP_004997679.1 hypothetical protein PTSG_01702 [Salpingoeca rosetta]
MTRNTTLCSFIIILCVLFSALSSCRASHLRAFLSTTDTRSIKTHTHTRPFATPPPSSLQLPSLSALSSTTTPPLSFASTRLPAEPAPSQSLVSFCAAPVAMEEKDDASRTPPTVESLFGRHLTDDLREQFQSTYTHWISCCERIAFFKALGPDDLCATITRALPVENAHTDVPPAGYAMLVTALVTKDWGVDTFRPIVMRVLTASACEAKSSVSVMLAAYTAATVCVRNSTAAQCESLVQGCDLQDILLKTMLHHSGSPLVLAVAIAFVYTLAEAVPNHVLRTCFTDIDFALQLMGRSAMTRLNEQAMVHFVADVAHLALQHELVAPKALAEPFPTVLLHRLMIADRDPTKTEDALEVITKVAMALGNDIYNWMDKHMKSLSFDQGLLVKAAVDEFWEAPAEAQDEADDTKQRKKMRAVLLGTLLMQDTLLYQGKIILFCIPSKYWQWLISTIEDMTYTVPEKTLIWRALSNMLFTHRLPERGRGQYGAVSCIDDLATAARRFLKRYPKSGTCVTVPLATEMCWDLMRHLITKVRQMLETSAPSEETCARLTLIGQMLVGDGCGASSSDAACPDTRASDAATPDARPSDAASSSGARSPDERDQPGLMCFCGCGKVYVKPPTKADADLLVCVILQAMQWRGDVGDLEVSAAMQLQMLVPYKAIWESVLEVDAIPVLLGLLRRHARGRDGASGDMAWYMTQVLTTLCTAGTRARMLIAETRLGLTTLLSLVSDPWFHLTTGHQALMPLVSIITDAKAKSVALPTLRQLGVTSIDEYISGMFSFEKVPSPASGEVPADVLHVMQRLKEDRVACLDVAVDFLYTLLDDSEEDARKVRTYYVPVSRTTLTALMERAASLGRDDTEKIGNTLMVVECLLNMGGRGESNALEFVATRPIKAFIKIVRRFMGTGGEIFAGCVSLSLLVLGRVGIQPVAAVLCDVSRRHPKLSAVATLERSHDMIKQSGISYCPYGTSFEKLRELVELVKEQLRAVNQPATGNA